MPRIINRLSIHKLFYQISSRGFLEERSVVKTPVTTITPNIQDYYQLLEACIWSKSLSQGKRIHQHLLKNTNCSTLEKSILLEKLTHLYLSCNKVELARRLFDRILNPSVILYNLIIRAYAWHGPFDSAIHLYHDMLESGVRPTKYTFPFVLKACSALQAIEEGRSIHNDAKRFGHSCDVYVSTALVDMYGKCGCLEDAQDLFDNMFHRDAVAWNAIIAGLSLHGLHKDSIWYVIRMQEEGVFPNSSTIVSFLPTIAQSKALGQGKTVHGYSIRRNFTGSVEVETALLDMYGKCQYLLYARRIFDVMSSKNEVTWSAMIGAYVISDIMTDAIVLFNQMLSCSLNPTAVTLGSVLRACANLNDSNRGRQIHCYTIKTDFVSDKMVSNTVLSMYAKCGIINEAIRLFDEMVLKDTTSYSAIISGCVRNGDAELGLSLFRKMQLSGTHPDVVTMVGVLPACAHLAALKQGRCTHGYLIVGGFEKDSSISNALTDMYSKCGEINTAREVFDRMDERDIISWNAMMMGYGIHGLGKKALSLFSDFLAINLKPDDVTFISLISACAHSGLVAEGKYLFDIMRSVYNFVPRMEHYICMVNLLGRAGLLSEAHSFIRRMPFEPDVRVWSALLAACRIHKNIETGEEVAKRIENLGFESSGNLVLLSNIYCSAGRWDDAANVRVMQREKGLTKSPGCSWVEINGLVHGFVSGDQAHPQSAQINKKLEELLVEMKRLGYRAESSFVLQDVEDEEKEGILLYHSEKLAIAFGILGLGPGKPILVTMNMRICGDCHSAIKLITVIAKREITVRDANRFHHFKDGVCNCRDFW